MSNFTPISIFCRPRGVKSPKFYLFSTSFCGGATYRHKDIVAELVCTTIPVPLFNDIKTVSEFKWLNNDGWLVGRLTSVQK